MAATLFDDSQFIDLLISLLVKDRQFLRTCARLVEVDDFKPKAGSSSTKEYHRYTIVKIALAHWERYKDPVHDLLSAELLDHCKKRNIAGDKKAELLKLGRRYCKKTVAAVDSITDKVVQFKQELKKASAVQEMIDLQTRGELTNEKWLEISKTAIETIEGTAYTVSNYLEELESRIDRRNLKTDHRFPVTLIEQLDAKVRAIARGHMGLILAPYKRGKSLMLIWLAVAYVIQRLNVLFITLEDPHEDVEDRFDACVTHLPIKKLATMRRTLKERFRFFKRLIRSRIKIYDCTERKLTVAGIEAIYEDERNKGFTADVIIVDYDDEIAPSKRNPERRLELADIYRDLRQLASRKNAILWTAAQTKRSTASKRILGGDDLAEDISKVRKVAMALSLGQGDWGEDSIFIWVAAHKFDRQHIGCNIMSNKNRMLIYDREATLKAARNPEKYINRDEEIGDTK
jgi:replicative DNA helicase